MHIWSFTNEYEPDILGGLGIVATKLTQSLATQNMSIRVFTKGNRGQRVTTTRQNGVRLIRFPQDSQYHSSKKKLFRLDPFIDWLIQERLEKPALIHVHSVQFTEMAEFFRKNYKIPIVYTCHSLLATETNPANQSSYASRQKRLLRIADRVVVPSNWQKQKLVQIHPFCSGKTKVIQHGVELKPSTYNASKYRLLFAGRIVQSKGIEDLLEAISILSKSQSNVSLDVIGTGSPGYMRKLHALTQSLEIRSNVKWLGYKGHHSLLRLYPQYGAVVMPSKQESFGLVALEALANGVPLVASRSGGLGEIVDSNVAEVIPRIAASDIAKAIENMWEQRSHTETRIEKGLSRARNYRWSQLAAKYRDVFEKCRR